MATFKTFEEIESWQKSRELSNVIYDLTLTGTFSKDYSLRDQINRSSGSVMDNIAEGFERGGNKEFIHFLSISKASVGEVRSQLYRALDRKHITKDTFEVLKENALSISKLITSLMKYLIGNDMRGMKFHEPQEAYTSSLNQQNLNSH